MVRLDSGRLRREVGGAGPCRLSGARIGRRIGGPEAQRRANLADLLLMNPNSDVATTRAMVAIARTILPRIGGWTAPSGPGMIVTDEALRTAAELVAAAVLPPVRGIIVSAFGDPGRAALSRRMACPVVGIGAAAARAAGAGGRRFAVVTTTPGLRTSIDALMQAEAGAGSYAGCHLTPGDPVALMADADRLDAALLAGIETAARDGAGAVIIGGGPLAEAAERLAAVSPVPLVAPILAAARELRHHVGAEQGADLPPERADSVKFLPR